MKYLFLLLETFAVDEVTHLNPRLIYIKKCCAIHHCQSAELLLWLQRRAFASLIVLYEIKGQDWLLISNLFVSKTVEFLAIDYIYCKLLIGRCTSPREQVITSMNFGHATALLSCKPCLTKIR